MFALLTVCLLGLSGPAAAQQSLADRVVRELRDEGFGRITVSRTLLGRVRLVGESRTLRREVVLNPRTGVILRDYTRRRTGVADGVGPEQDGTANRASAEKPSGRGGGDHGEGGDGVDDGGDDRPGDGGSLDDDGDADDDGDSDAEDRDDGDGDADDDGDSDAEDRDDGDGDADGDDEDEDDD